LSEPDSGVSITLVRVFILETGWQKEINVSYNNSSNSYGSRNRSGGNNFRSGGNRSGGNRRYGGRKTSSIDVNRLIRKVDVLAPEAEKVKSSFGFHELNIAEGIKKNVISKGFTEPTPIQEQAIPHLLLGKDVVGIANTGTGKTAAFLIPLLDKVHNDRNQNVLIIAPTRELAEQIDMEIKAFSKFMNIYSVLCVGGMSITNQLRELRRSHNFVVGTPGRLIDLGNRSAINFRNFNSIVLDEVDRMLDMGFVKDIKAIIAKLPEQRHSMFFSATMSQDVENVMNLITKDYIKVSVKTGDTSANINQDIIRVKNRDEKMAKLEELLATEDFKKVIIFVRTKHGVDKIDDELYKKGFKVDCIHGNKTQGSRRKALENFKTGRADILVATDVAARGLDIPNVSHVINFDMPETYEDYVHRIGRTGRASKLGHALTFVEG
jgi:superfamily II DNA/RNA helicase